MAQLLVQGAMLAGFVCAGALIVWSARRYVDETVPTPLDMMSDFSRMHDIGAVNDAEFKRIKQVVGQFR